MVVSARSLSRARTCHRDRRAQNETIYTDRPTAFHPPAVIDHPQGDSNPCLQDENLISWATRRWGLVVTDSLRTVRCCVKIATGRISAEPTTTGRPAWSGMGPDVHRDLPVLDYSTGKLALAHATRFVIQLSSPRSAYFRFAGSMAPENATAPKNATLLGMHATPPVKSPDDGRPIGRSLPPR